MWHREPLFVVCCMASHIEIWRPPLSQCQGVSEIGYGTLRVSPAQEAEAPGPVLAWNAAEEMVWCNLAGGELVHWEEALGELANRIGLAGGVP